MKKYILVPLLILSLTVSISACGKTTSEKAAEKAQEELGLSDDEAAELKEVYDDVLEEDTADTTAESETESSEKVKELKSYELKDEVKNADASELLFQVDDIVLRLDGSMTFHDVITAFGNNEEKYIWKEDANNVFDNPEDAESTVIRAGGFRSFDVCKVVSEESDAIEIAELRFLNPSDDEVETSALLLTEIFAPSRSKEVSYYFWYPGGISLTDTSALTWENTEEVLEKAGYVQTAKPKEEDGENMNYFDAQDNGVPAFFYKDPDLQRYFCFYQNQPSPWSMAFSIDFSEKATNKGFGSPLIGN